MYEITTEERSEIKEHAEKAIEHVSKLLDCLDGLGGGAGQMGQRDGDEWYIRQMQQRGGSGYGDRDEMGYREDMMGERRGVRGTGRYGMRMGYREPTPYYRNF